MSDIEPQQQVEAQETVAPVAAAEVEAENAAPAAAAPSEPAVAVVAEETTAPVEVTAAPVVEEPAADAAPVSASAASADDDVVELDTASARRVAHPEPSASDEELDDQINDDTSSGVDSEPVADAHERLTAFMAAAMAADPKLAAATNSALEAMGAPSAAAAESATDAEDVVSPRFSRTAEQEAKAKEEMQASVQEVQEFLNRQVAAAAAASSSSASTASSADAKAARKAAFDAKVAARQAEIRASKGGVRFEDEEEEDEDELDDERLGGRGAGASADSDLAARLARAAEIQRAHNRKLAAEEDEDEDEEQDDEAAPVAQSFLPWLQGKVAAKWRGKTATAVRSQIRWASGAAFQLGKTLSWNLLTGALIALPPLIILNAVETNHLQQQARIMNAVPDEGIRNYIVMGEVPQQRMADHQNIGSMQL